MTRLKRKARKATRCKMAVSMAKKKMSQMGQGGSPFEMMQKMVAQMVEGGKPPPDGQDDEHCMDMFRRC